MLLAMDNSHFNPGGFLAADLRLVWLFDFALEEMGVLISLDCFLHRLLLPVVMRFSRTLGDLSMFKKKEA